jgi:hypothetical protein
MSDTINIEISECCSGATTALLQIVGDGTDSYTNTSLIGKSILIIFIDESCQIEKIKVVCDFMIKLYKLKIFRIINEILINEEI